MGNDVPRPAVESVLDVADAFRNLLDGRLLGRDVAEEEEAVRAQPGERLEKTLVGLDVLFVVHPQNLLLHQRPVPEDLRAVVEPAADDVAPLRVPPQKVRAVERDVAVVGVVPPGDVRQRVPGHAQRSVGQRHDFERADFGRDVGRLEQLLPARLVHAVSAPARVSKEDVVVG